MEPIFKKCLLAIERINEVSFPMMEQAYNTYIDVNKQKIISSQCLNDAKAYAIAAKDTISSGQIDNKNIKSYLSKLEDIDHKLKKKSKDLHELLSKNLNNYIKLSNEFVNKNLSYLQYMKTGQIPAQELLMDIINLGKKIQETTNETIPNYSKEVERFLKKSEDAICDDAYNVYNKIQKLDSGTLPRIKTREWTYLESGFFERRGAFVGRDYYSKE